MNLCSGRELAVCFPPRHWRRLQPCALGVVLLACFLAGCDLDVLDMHEQPRYEPLEGSNFFGDGLSARPLVAGTVARGQLNADEGFYTGKQQGQLIAKLPLKLDRQLIERGRERFNINCSVCHGQTGVGNGMIVQRGYRRPPSLHIDRLRNAPAGHYFDVITNGFGAMPSYNVQIEPKDRWAIVAYIRALQLSQNATLEDVPPQERKQLLRGAP